MGERLDAVVDWIQAKISDSSSRAVVVVHCAAGISRSSTVVLGFLVKYRNKSLREAFAHALSRRRVVWPNAGFMRLLGRKEMLWRKVGKPTITSEEYQNWTEFDLDSYQMAKLVDRG